MAEFDAAAFARWFKENYDKSPYKSLRDVARKIGVSPETVSRIARAGEQPFSDRASRPKIKLVDSLSDLFGRPHDEARHIAGWAGENVSYRKKPETVRELVDRLNELGFEIIFDNDDDVFTPEDVEDFIDEVKIRFLYKSQKRKKDL